MIGFVPDKQPIQYLETINVFISIYVILVFEIINDLMKLHASLIGLRKNKDGDYAYNEQGLDDRRNEGDISFLKPVKNSS